MDSFSKLANFRLNTCVATEAQKENKNNGKRTETISWELQLLEDKEEGWVYNLHVALLHIFDSLVHVIRDLLPHTDSELSLQLALSPHLRGKNGPQSNNLFLNPGKFLKRKAIN